jgi:hypothetical protein
LNPHTCDECLNIFCQSCINENIKKNDSCICGVDKKKIVTAPKLIFDMLSKKFFYCKNKEEGCEQIINYNDILSHENNCRFRLIKCKNKECNIWKKNEDIEEHEKDCEFNLKKCCFCSKEIITKNLKEHEEDCEESIKICKGCKSEIKKKDLVEHESHCDKIKIKCDYCEIEFLRSFFKKHDVLNCLKNLIYDYENINLTHIRELKNEIETILDKLQENDNYLNYNCSNCNKFSCPGQLEKCNLCKIYFCNHCAKNILNNCDDCKMKLCLDCFEFSDIRTKCYMCNDKEKKNFSSSFKGCKRFAPLVPIDAEKNIIKYKPQ